ncbi:uncharacterized protein LOC136039641 [Artemia franciscana]|uniref:uncharacterized protein LOC136039641 n=1 Tax=Artemia franciscana TaxID=6661 RepID=UPI0032DAA1FE
MVDASAIVATIASIAHFVILTYSVSPGIGQVIEVVAPNAFTGVQETGGVTEDSHMYYSSFFYPEVSGKWKKYWLDLTKDPESHTLLPGAHRKTATIYVTFDIPFYGHIVNNITIATGGFLYMGDYLHPWLAATQYAAPLLADFDTMSNLNSSIRYKDNGTALTVQWDQVVIHNRTDLGSFTFQLILKNTGEVLFVYKDVPVNITDINDDKPPFVLVNNPVRVGLYDAYITEKTLFFDRRKIIVWEHKVDFKDNYFIGNGTLLYFTPLPTCLSLKTCSECVQGKETIGFQCIWCPLANRCSDGIDRKPQDWLIKGCDSNHLDTVQKCNEYEKLTSAVVSWEEKDEYSTGEEYDYEFRVDPDRHVKSFNGTDIGITNPTEDSHMYYKSSFYPEVSRTWKEYWLDLTKDPESHTVLPGAHRKMATIYVTFDFPFYGHIVNNVTIATGGFLYMGDYLKDYLNALAAKQYAAPLLADFDTMSNPNSSIRYKDNGTALTVQWDQVVIHKRTDLGSFTFQLILKNTGDVLFVYKDVPVNIRDINDNKHPVRVGLYDAYTIEKTLFFVRRKIFFMYHKVDFKDNYFIGNGTLLYFTPLPTCLSLKTCSECVQGKETIGFQTPSQLIPLVAEHQHQADQGKLQLSLNKSCAMSVNFLKKKKSIDESAAL